MKKKMIFILSVLMLVVGSASAELRLHYEFETFPPAVDSTGITTATVHGTGLALESGSMSFDGSSWLTLDTTTGFAELLGRPGGTHAHDMTIALWMKAGTTANDARVLSDTIQEGMWMIQLQRDGDTAGLYVRLKEGKGDDFQGTIPDVFDDQWHHIALVIDQDDDGDGGAQGVKVYKDADLVLERALGMEWYQLRNNFGVGANWDGADPYTGLIGDFRIYTDELWTQAQIEDLVTSPVATIDVGDGVEVTEDQLDHPTDTYTVSMLYAPPIDTDGDTIQGVKVTMEFPDDQIGIDPNGFIFTADNWETPQTFTVTAIDDLDPQGDRIVDINHSLIVLDPDDNVMSMTDPNVADPLFVHPGFETGTKIVPVTILDNEMHYGILIDELDGIAVSEQEPATATDTYTVVLQKPPTITVLVDINITDGQTTVDKTTLTFDSDNWAIPQVVTVTAVDDTAGEDDPHTGQILHSVPDLGTSEEALNWFNAPILPNPTVDININDNDCRADRIPPGDLDGDCDIDLADFAEVAANWLNCTLPNVPGCE